MDSSEILLLLEQFDDNLDDLEKSIEPLLKGSLSAALSKLPLLDKAKLYILVTYAIESILFSYLRLNGVNARDQPVFNELTRVKQYFDKIKALETAHTKNPAKLDKPAAVRFIKNGLMGNDSLDLERSKASLGEVSSTSNRFHEDTKEFIDDDADELNVVGDQVDVSNPEREERVPAAATPSKKRKVVG